MTHMPDVEPERHGYDRIFKLVIVAPTCFYYQVDLFRQLAHHPGFNLKVYFCSDEALKASDVRDMYKVNASWGDENELLNGYDYQFLKNYSFRPSYLNWPHGLMNFGIFKEIKKERPDAIILMSWMNLVWWTAMFAGICFKVPVFFLTDANIQGDTSGSRWKKLVKKLILGAGIFKNASGFLCAGVANKELYESYKVPQSKMISFAYSWGYKPMLEVAQSLSEQKHIILQQFGINSGNKIILYVGRLSAEKSPEHLLQAFNMLRTSDVSLVFAGDGDMRTELQEYVAENNMDSVYFLGFLNRTEIFKCYAVADLLVLPSKRETWGMVINEALTFGVPTIASEEVGAARDLIIHGENGYVFPHGDLITLAGYMDNLLSASTQERENFKKMSLDLIKDWIDRDLCEDLYEYCQNSLSN